MSRSKRRLLFRARKRSFAESVEFPRWIATIGVLLIALVLLLAVLSDPDGKLSRPGLGGYLYIAGVVGVVTFLAYADRNRDSAGKNRENRPGYKGR